MLVAIVTPSYEPEIGGIESYTGELSRALVRVGCHVDVITQSAHGASKNRERPESSGDINVLRFEDRTHTRSFRVAPGLWRHLRTNGTTYDIVHAHNFHASPALAAVSLSRSPVVFSPHFHAVGHTVAAKILHVPYDRVARYIFKKAEITVCDSMAELELLRECYPEAAPSMRLIGTGVDVKRLLGVEPFAEEEPVFLTGGRLVDYKRVRLAIESFAHVASEAVLVITGTGPEEDGIRQRIRELGLVGRVRLLGNIDRETLSRWQRTALATISLSTNEAFGMGVAEAAVAGAFIVASDIPAHREVATLAGDTAGLVSVAARPAEIGGFLHDVLQRPKREPSQLGFLTWNEVAQAALSVYSEVLR